LIVHEPAMLEEAMGFLEPGYRRGFVDCTCGSGGHAEAAAEKLTGDARLLCLDKDPEACDRTRERLRCFGEKVSVMRSDFRELGRVTDEWGVEPDAFLFDLGVSTEQLLSPARGFSFSSDGPLDMRMDPSSFLTAEEIVNRYPETRLAEVLRKNADEPRARRIARAIVRARPLRGTAELAELVSRHAGRRKHHRATKTFLALRIEVNDELSALADVLLQAAGLLRPGGRIVAISYHSGEDRTVKIRFRELSRSGFAVLTKKPVRPSPEEVARNRRARSAKMRAVEKLQ